MPAGVRFSGTTASGCTTFARIATSKRFAEITQGDQRPWPVERVIGEPTAEYRDMFEGYLRLVPMLHAGKSSEDSIAAMKSIQDSDFEFYGGLLQGMLGANPHHEPQIGFDRVQSAEDRFLFGPDGRLVYQIGHVFTLQMHIVDKQHTRGLFLGDFFAIEEKGPRCLNKLLPELLRTRL